MLIIVHQPYIAHIVHQPVTTTTVFLIASFIEEIIEHSLLHRM